MKKPDFSNTMLEYTLVCDNTTIGANEYTKGSPQVSANMNFSLMKSNGEFDGRINVYISLPNKVGNLGNLGREIRVLVPADLMEGEDI